MKQDQDEYSRAFRGEEEAPAMMSEDAADGAAEAPAVAVVIDPAAAVDESEVGMDANEAADPAEAGMAEGEGMADEMAGTDTEELPMMEEGAEMAEGEMSPEDVQRQKSWEGRLRKREEELAAREAALSEAPAAAVDGDIAEIRQRLAEDFGEEFVTMITAIAASEAKKLAETDFSERVGSISQTIDSLIRDTREAFNAMHFGAIAEAHEDFQEVAESEAFRAWIDGMPEADKARAEAIVQGGSTGQIIKLLSDYKAHAKASEESGAMDDLAMDAAAGVRSSSPVRLPSRSPVGADEEYKAAWSQM